MDNKELFRKDQQKMLSYIKDMLIGPRYGEDEILYAKNINPVDLYLMGMIHPLKYLEGQNNETDQDSSEEEEENLFQKKPPSLGISFYFEKSDNFDFEINTAMYKELKLIDDLYLEELKNMLSNSKDPNHNKDDLFELIDSYTNELDLLEENILKIKQQYCELKEIKIENIPNTFLVKAWKRIPLNFKANININSNNDQYLFHDKIRVNFIWRKYKNGFLVTVTAINNIKESDTKSYIESQLFQSKISIYSVKNMNITTYPNINTLKYDKEEEELALMYRNEKSYAIGHSCAVEWSIIDSKVIKLETTFIPSVSVKPVTTKLDSNENDNVLKLQYLANKNLDKKVLEKDLNKFVESYELWFLKQNHQDIGEYSKEAKKRILNRIQKAISRMKNGISVLLRNDEILKSFQLANEAMLMQMIHGKEFKEIKVKDEISFKRPDYFSPNFESYAWRPFQLAFLLITLESLVNVNSSDRDIVDLIWFPTGGGKTEAYLAVAAFELFYRRIKYKEKGSGTTVIKRYTLRLLTSQQFQRASGLICACEILRRDNVVLLGTTEFDIGLWVGGASSPNSFSDTHGTGSHELYINMLEQDIPENKFQVQKCPWCGTRIIPQRRTNSREHYGINSTQTSFEFFCPTISCDFHQKLPINVVDEALYKKPPSFLIGTVDKFARLTWVDKASSFFGIGQENTLPPSLIIQDEMHLISGPLGTISGIYEAAIDTILTTLNAKPKILAATATIRSAEDQIKKLFAKQVSIFPSPGINADDSYFAKIDQKKDGRLYIGIMSQSGTQTSAIVDIASVLAEAPAELDLNPKSKDAYWTQLIYHNSKKELAKTNSLSNDDIHLRLDLITNDMSKKRKIKSVIELSGDKKGEEMTSILEQMNSSLLNNADDVIDIIPCTNVISVGVDVSRLGLILMHGQPKTTAEYIQASSRVGRDEVPGIVVTVYPSANPRNRSHYENFIPYHRALYKFVEPTSVTPYASPARERALHAALIIVMRHANNLGDNEHAKLFNPEETKTKNILNTLLKRMQKADPTEKDNIKKDLDNLVQEWQNKISEFGDKLRYDNNKSNRALVPLMSNFEDINPRGWKTLNSMRGVDATIQIHVNGKVYDEN